jgi:hypothetical protein
MLPLRSQLLGFVLGMVPVAVSAADWVVPPISGELAGDFMPLNLPDAPKLHWQVTARGVEGSERELAVAIDGNGVRMRVAARVDAAANGTWRIDEATVELGAWLPPAIAMVAKRSTEFTLTGVVEVSGQGTWRDGKLGGRALLRLRNGRLDVPKRKVTLEGLALEVAIDDLATGRTAPGQTFAWQSGKYDDVPIGAGHFAFSANGADVQVTAATIEVFAGQLELAGFKFSLKDAATKVNATVRGFDLALLQPFLPKIVSDSRGRLDGTMQIGWGPDGLQIGDGQLGLRAGEKAELRFMPQPGILAGSLPPQVTKYYTGLADLEQGKVPLRAEVLDIVLTPAGDAEGRTALVHVAGGPVDPRLKAPIDLTFNVRAPLEWFINFGSKLK